MIDEVLRSFMEGPVMQTAATVDAAHRCAIARCAGVAVAPAGTELAVLVSAWQWPQAVANLRQNGKLALTLTNPANYASYQVKGHASVGPAGAAEELLALRYCEGMAALLPHLRLPAGGIRLISRRGLVLVTLRAEQLYLQTPGPDAGRPLQGMP